MITHSASSTISRFFTSAGMLWILGISTAQGLEEVIVTAQKREQALQEVGISVTAFTGDQIRQLGMTNTEDLVGMTPNLNYTVPNAAGSQTNFFLRGVGLNDFADANENPVAVYVDEVYHSAVGGLSFQLYDLKRAEVLRGPQGTLFGRNTTGGLIHFVTKRPTDDFEAYGELTLAEYGQAKFEGAASGPLNSSKSLLGRFSFASNKHSGVTDNRVPGVSDYNETNAVAGRGQLLFKPNQDVDVLLAVHGSRNDASVGAWQHEVTTFSGVNGDVSVPLGLNQTTMAVDCNADGMLDAADLRTGVDCFGYRDTDGDVHAGEYDRDGDVRVKNSGASGRIDWRIGDMILTSITAYELNDRLQQEDTDASPAPLLIPTFGANTDQWTEELRLAGETGNFRWLGGFYYYNQDVDASYTLDLTNLGFVYFDAGYTQQTESWAAFGQVEWEIADQWTLIGGLRYTEEEKELDYLNVDVSGFFTGVVGLPTNVAFDFDRSSVGDLAVHNTDNITGKIELDWQPSDDLLVYASFSRGVKSAGFNTGFLDQTFLFASNTVATIPFDEETLHSYEAGFKSTLFGGTTRFNASAFYYDYMDFQTFRFELLNQVIFNTDAEVYGAEFELVTSPWQGWDFLLGVGLLDATAQDIPSPSGLEIRDRDMVAAPDVSVNGLARYQWSQWGGTMAVQGSFTYQSEVFYDIQNQPVSKENGYIIGNARLSYTSGTGNWSAALFVNNIGDEEYKTYTFDFTTFGFNQQAWGAPRWIGGTLTYNWD
jgi:iron complex outermembrane receptor protein